MVVTLYRLALAKNDVLLPVRERLLGPIHISLVRQVAPKFRKQSNDAENSWMVPVS